MTTYGATPQEWEHLAVRMGLVEDLLPVVSRPGAPVSSRSALREVGKVPSRYNAEREVVGMPAWTQHRSTERDVARWQVEPDYGICLQTRRVRAIDIDIPDEATSHQVRGAIELALGELPLRFRQGTGKCLLTFRMEGNWTKRVVRTEHGPIEFLAAGQQFIAVGTHPSGTRYEWRGGLPVDLPWITAAEFEALWGALVDAVGVGSSVGRPVGARAAVARSAADVAAGDEVLRYLERAGWIQSFDGQGRAHITCPWEHEHSGGEAGDGSTTYFPAGVGGFEQGHFRCLHAHCDHRTDGDFLEAVGYAGEGFEVVPSEPAPGEVDAPLLLPPFDRDNHGRILATAGNLEMALRRADVCGVHIGLDEFNDEIMLADWSDKSLLWRRFKDADYTRTRIRLERGGFLSIGRELLRDVVVLVAEDKRFDSAQVWLDRLRWDGVPRIESFLSTHFNARDSAYARSVALYLWTALAGRVMNPGCKADMVPVFIGEQGGGKTTGVAAMVPGTDHYMEVRLDEAEIELARRMRGKLIGEIGELRGMASRDIEHIKAFVTRTHEEWIPKYREFATNFPRRLVFVGTTNAEEFLADETGNRRWLPVRVGKVDVGAIARDREQLWAEAATRWLADGVMWHDAEQRGAETHAEHMISDPWAEAVARWLESPAGFEPGGALNGEGEVTISAILQEALGVSVSQLAKKDEFRVGRILRAFGYEKKRIRKGLQLAYVWSRAKG